MNDFVVCRAAHIEFSLSDMSGGSGGGKRDAGLKAKALRIQDWGKTLNLRAQPRQQPSKKQHVLIEPVGQAQMRGDSIFISLPVFLLAFWVFFMLLVDE